jgi:hypothetical protein
VCGVLSFGPRPPLLFVGARGTVGGGGSRVCVLIIDVHFLQCPEYWVRCIDVCRSC